MAVISRIISGTAAILAIAANPASASPVLAPRAVINHDAVVSLPQTVPVDTTGPIYLAYQPLLKVVNGCVPFPAVDAEGNTSGGLQTSGSSNGHCSKSTGQIYVRSATYNGMDALMYAWYFPKDSPVDGLGHRHDWEGTIVWLKNGTSTAADNIVAVCPSAHGGWDCSKDGFTLKDSRPLIKYESVFPVNHATGLTTEEGGSQPLVAWESLPTPALNALQTTDFGAANVPFIDSHFQDNLGKCDL